MVLLFLLFALVTLLKEGCAASLLAMFEAKMTMVLSDTVCRILSVRKDKVVMT